jgi:Domain of unknown function (DUF3598)
MKSQWECVLENRGEWVGSFTVISPSGELIEDIPSLISIADTEDHRSIHLSLKRFYPLPGSTELFPKEVTLNFSTPNPGALFFETGAFSDGAISIAAGVKTITEFCLVGIDRRWRIVQVFNPDLQLDRVTVIREQRQGTNAPERPDLTISDLLGTWQGTATTLYPDDRSPTINPTSSTVIVSDSGYQWGAANLRSISNQVWQFTQADRSYQLLLLPDGGYSITPIQIATEHPCFVEIGWLHQPGILQRLVRRYDRTGAWESATFITESR